MKLTTFVVMAGMIMVAPVAYPGNDPLVSEIYQRLTGQSGGAVTLPAGPIEVSLRRAAEAEAVATRNELEANRGGDGRLFMGITAASQANPFVILHNALAAGHILDAQLLEWVSQQARAVASALQAQLEGEQKQTAARFMEQQITTFENQAKACIQELQAIQQQRQLNAAQATAQAALKTAQDANARAAAANARAAAAQQAAEQLQFDAAARQMTRSVSHPYNPF